MLGFFQQSVFSLHLIPRLLLFWAWLGKELVKSNLQVAWEVITPRPSMNRAIISVPLHVSTDGLVTVVGNAITLTPGTLSLDVSPDRKTLYIHTMWVEDPDEFRREIKDGFERRVLELMR